mgnify:CR=1 FL=1
MAEMQNPNTDGDSTVLCGANSYVEKYYLNEQFSGLPESIKQELQIMCVMYTEDIGGIILLGSVLILIVPSKTTRSEISKNFITE